jgi:cholestenol delta-isomerase
LLSLFFFHPPPFVSTLPIEYFFHGFASLRSTMAANSSLPLGIHQHPYYPIEKEIVGYLANKWGTLDLLLVFAAGCVAIFSVTYVMVKRLRPSASTSDLATIMWFVLCGCIHSFFEGYFAYNFRNMGGLNDLFGMLWKEYALSDSRYLTQDAFVLCMETVTAVRP